ncbi:ROK family protein [Clostridium butyricum]|uniref:Putative sugar kinase n=1 Tax=Clostridium butyricum E4 str. BoNT E BL5262 TaxID=632245 RepID=C4ILM8_CLOBU|nr:ROK family protein [Clostridium butyricum]EDT75767.1 putative sugar kinase [Clostridium butyricum 5521]EEP52672.1 putative sugar kinase [Clostridium butyricum E4 str. BoNT E BL5262]NFL29850.1 ROK family protein [Clostridium butyricum]NFS17544.1 ROK family protein [Clostridium butyricum]
MKYNLGIDIGGTFIKYALVDNKYEIRDKWKVETIKFETKDNFYDYICSNIKSLDLVDKIGISAPGLIDENSNVRSYAAENVVIMYGTNINEEISKRTNRTTSAINDAKSAGLCEFKIGNAKGSKLSAFFIIGTGTGGCICDEKGVVYGKDSFAGEFHHIPHINLDTGKIDRLGDFSSMTGLINIYNGKVDDFNKLRYGHEICNKYLNDDIVAKEAFEEWIRNICVHLITISVFYNPDVICIGGGISEEAWFINLIKNKFKHMSREYIFNKDVITTRIEKCRYNNDANILGAVINVENL